MVLQLRNLSILSALCRALLRVCVDVLAFWKSRREGRKFSLIPCQAVCLAGRRCDF